MQNTEIFNIEGTNYKIRITAFDEHKKPKMLRQVYHIDEPDLDNPIYENCLVFESKGLRDKFLTVFQTQENANYMYEVEFKQVLS